MRCRHPCSSASFACVSRQATVHSAHRYHSLLCAHNPQYGRRQQACMPQWAARANYGASLQTTLFSTFQHIALRRCLILGGGETPQAAAYVFMHFTHVAVVKCKPVRGTRRISQFRACTARCKDHTLQCDKCSATCATERCMHMQFARVVTVQSTFIHSKSQG